MGRPYHYVRSVLRCIRPWAHDGNLMLFCSKEWKRMSRCKITRTKLPIWDGNWLLRYQFFYIIFFITNIYKYWFLKCKITISYHVVMKQHAKKICRKSWWVSLSFRSCIMTVFDKKETLPFLWTKLFVRACSVPCYYQIIVIHLMSAALLSVKCWELLIFFQIRLFVCFSWLGIDVRIFNSYVNYQNQNLKLLK